VSHRERPRRTNGTRNCLYSQVAGAETRMKQNMHYNMHPRVTCTRSCLFLNHTFSISSLAEASLSTSK